MEAGTLGTAAAGGGAARQGSSPARRAAKQSNNVNRSGRERVVGAFQRGQLGQQDSFIRQTSQRAGRTVPLERC